MVKCHVEILVNRSEFHIVFTFYRMFIFNMKQKTMDVICGRKISFELIDLHCNKDSFASACWGKTVGKVSASFEIQQTSQVSQEVQIYFDILPAPDEKAKTTMQTSFSFPQNITLFSECNI